MYKTTVKVGVFWKGPEYDLKPRRWFWLARFFARLHLMKYPHRVANIRRVG